MLKGKWYKVYWKFRNAGPGSRSQTLKVWAFSFTSAAQTAKIKLATEKNFDEEKILIVRIDLMSE